MPIGCDECGKPAALVGDESGKKNMCPWCIAKRRPHVMAMWAREFIGQEGGKASSRAMTKAQRSARAKRASQARWAKVRAAKAASDDGHVTATFTGSTCMSDAELAKGICVALKSQRISRAMRKAKVRAEKKIAKA